MTHFKRLWSHFLIFVNHSLCAPQPPCPWHFPRLSSHPPPESPNAAARCAGSGCWRGTAQSSCRLVALTIEILTNSHVPKVETIVVTNSNLDWKMLQKSPRTWKLKHVKTVESCRCDCQISLPNLYFSWGPKKLVGLWPPVEPQPDSQA